MSNEQLQKITIVTHDGTFHTDEIFGVAILKILFEDENVEIIRSRDPEIIEKGDYVVDVGCVYDPNINKFDHHQEGGAGERENGIPYSAFGLVWKRFGEELCGSQEVAERIERSMVFPIDAADSGVETYIKTNDHMVPYIFHNITDAFRPSWKESEGGRTFDDGFFEVLDIAVQVLRREIHRSKDELEGQRFVHEIYEKAEDKRIILIEGHYPWERVLNQYTEPLFVVKPDFFNGQWKVKTVRSRPDSSFENRKDLPKEWAGKRGEELAAISGVDDAVFCHNKLFIAVAASKEGAIKLAKLAVEN